MSPPLTALRNSVVSIWDDKGNLRGLGYRIAPDLVITCAHVVTEALGIVREHPSPPTGEVWIRAPFLTNPNTQDHPIAARVCPGGWFPRRETSGTSELADLALLHLAESLPDRTADLDVGLSFPDRNFIAYGGIEGHDRHLIPLEGTVSQSIANGRYELRMAKGRYGIEEGCSGGPVCDRHTGTVVGLIAQEESDSEITGGFMIPATHLRQALDQAGLTPPAPARPLAALSDWVERQVAPLDYTLASACKRFIDYYAGTPEEPMPFAGRAEEMADLDDWFAHDGGFRLVSGPAGRGKSALLLHWADTQLAGNADLQFLFLPISIRFDSSDELRGLRLLHVQLATLFSELRFPPEARPDPTDYRNRIGVGWRAISDHPERRFLLVIDGADEAAGAWIGQMVLPDEIPSNLTILFAARHKPGHQDGQAWLKDFRFAPTMSMAPPLELPPLTEAAVAEAIVQLGYPLDALIDKEQVLQALYRLTDAGDPLLVNLWVRQLWDVRETATRYTAADLQRMRPSFSGFLAVWLEEQQKLWEKQALEVHSEDLDRRLRLLALAYSPLRLQDLLAVQAPLSFPVPWDYAFTRRILDSASRLVVKVGEGEDAGYAFVHPRLGDHYREELFKRKEERQVFPRAFRDWGAETVRRLHAVELAPEECPRYLLRHYLDHVAEAHLEPEAALDDHLLPLLAGDGWHRAWHEEEGAYGGFLADLDRIQHTLRQANSARTAPPYRIAEELRVALCHASIQSLTANLPSKLIVALVQGSVWSGPRGLRVAEQLPAPRERAEALAAVAEHLTGESQQQALDQAMAAVKEIVDEEDRAWTIAAVAEHLAGEPDLLAQALTAAQTIGEEWKRTEALAAVAKHLAGEPDLLAQALTAAQAIGNERHRAQALTAVAKQLAGEPALLAQALTTAQVIPDENKRARTLAAVAEHLTGDLRQQTLDQALTIAQKIGDKYSAWALAAVAEHLTGEPRQQALDQAMAAAKEIVDEGGCALTIAAVAEHLTGEPRQQALNQALTTAQAIKDEVARDQALADVVEHLAGESALLAQALTAAQAVKNEWLRAEILAAVAEHLAGETDLLAQALTAAQTIGEEWKRTEALAAVAKQLAGEPALLAQALTAAQAIKNEWLRTEALAAVAEHLTSEPRQQAFAQALTAAQESQCGGRRTDTLADMAKHLIGEPSLLAQALSAIQAIGDEIDRTRTLAAVAEHLNGDLRQQTLDQALTTAQKIGHKDNRARALATLAEHLNGKPRQQALDQAMAAVKEIVDNENRAETLAAVAKHLAGEPALLAQALTAAQTIDDEWLRTEALAAVAKHLAGEPRQQALAQALTAAQTVESEMFRALALAAVTKRLASEPALLAQALTAAQAIGEEMYRAQALTAVAEQLAGEPRQQALAQALAQALTAAQAIGNEGPRALALAAVAKHLAGKPRQQALAQALTAAQATGDEIHRAQALIAVAEQLTGVKRHHALVQALTSAQAIKYPGPRARALAAVAERLAGEPALVESLWTGIEREHHPKLRIFVIETLVRTVTSPFDFSTFACALDLAMGVDRQSLLKLIASLAPAIADLGGPEAVQGTTEAIVDTANWWP